MGIEQIFKWHSSALSLIKCILPLILLGETIQEDEIGGK